MPPQRRSNKADDTDEPEATEATAADGPKIIDGPTGTIADPNDSRTGTLSVKVNSNVTLGNKFFPVGPDTVEVPDTAETRATLAAGHLTLAE